jgi:hypothetical protein
LHLIDHVGWYTDGWRILIAACATAASGEVKTTNEWRIWVHCRLTDPAVAIFADKKNGKITGRFRVDLDNRGKRFSKRYDTFAIAEQAEKDLKALWAAGGTLETSTVPIGGPKVLTLQALREEADGVIWEGTGQEQLNWAHIGTIIAIIGGSKPLKNLETADVDKVIKELKLLKKSEATINRYLSHLRKMLHWGVDRKRMPRAVFLDTKFEWCKESAGRTRWLTYVEEEEGLRAYLP